MKNAPTKHATRAGTIPDDLSLHWYLHHVMGRTVTPAIAQEISVRATLATDVLRYELTQEIPGYPERANAVAEVKGEPPFFK